MTDRLRRLVAGVLAPGFNGTAVPAWLRSAIDGGLGSVVLFGHNLQFDGEAPIEPDEQIGPGEPVEHFSRIAGLTTQLRAERVDLLIASDEEGGDVSRIEVTGGSSLPGAAALGAIGDVGLTADVAAAHGRLLRALGIDCALAPVADVNSNPGNPVIGVRSFGADAVGVAQQVVAYSAGLQDAGIMACVKHFPGHGDSAVDSHHALPYLDETLEDLAGRELVPFRAAIDAGVAAVMPGHLVVPAVDELPASISRRWIQILRAELGFDALVISDALDMAAVAATYGVPGAAVRGLQAGIDLLCLGNTRGIDDELMFTSCLDAIVAAVRDGLISEQQLQDSATRRVTAMAAVDVTPVVDIASAVADLRSIGRKAAELAIGPGWPPELSPLPADSRPVIVDLRHGRTMAAGPTSARLTDALQRTWPGSTSIGGPDAPALLPADPRPVLILVRSPVRDSAGGKALDALLRLRPDAVVIDTGWPTPTGHRRTVFSYGSAAVNIRLVCERLTGLGR
ncbi:glycoside hydrolase family 3 protein [Nakamurella lactea]|uniref:glycoside hydrolase family 3 protein n=1 Tax=Nakamurella lactea TaxID=459515 RepID=UPI000407EFBF|nr:glycoside hydrolase family 3 N-terminal domain-containing protein [Nakamurella lactea]